MRQGPLLDGLRVFRSPQVLMTQEDMAAVVLAAGGAMLASEPTEADDDVVAIATLTHEDKRLRLRLKEAGVTVCTQEFVLTGVLTQVLDRTAHVLKLEDAGVAQQL